MKRFFVIVIIGVAIILSIDILYNMYYTGASQLSPASPSSLLSSNEHSGGSDAAQQTSVIIGNEQGALSGVESAGGR